MVQPSFCGTAFDDFAISDGDRLRDDGSVEREVLRILEHEGVGGERLFFFDDDGGIGGDV